MSQELENRYIVIKRKGLEDLIRKGCFSNDELQSFTKVLAYCGNVDSVTIEKDWPEYDAVVQMLFERINGV